MVEGGLGWIVHRSSLVIGEAKEKEPRRQGRGRRVKEQKEEEEERGMERRKKLGRNRKGRGEKEGTAGGENKNWGQLRPLEAGGVQG